MSEAVAMYEGDLSLIKQDLWDDLRRLSALNVENTDPSRLADMLEKAGALATHAPQSPRSQIYDQYQAVKNERDGAVQALAAQKLELDSL